MDYYRLTIPIPKQPWLWLRFRISTILLLITILAIVLAWRRDHRRMEAEIYRLSYPSAYYQASQATGPPDVTSQGDSHKAWCSATLDSDDDWLQLEYETPIVPSAIIVHENYGSGAIVRITHVPSFGIETTLWEGTSPGSPGSAGSFTKLPVTTNIKTNRIKIYLKQSAVTNWNEIDAVALVDSNGKATWAIGAKASSTWGQPRGADEFDTALW